MHERMRWLMSITMAAGLTMGTVNAERAAGTRATRTAGVDQPANGVPVPLWPAGAPNAVGAEPVDVPTLTPYLPASPVSTGTSVIVFPGGGYANLAMDHEGEQVAEWFNSLGVTAFVVKYRLGPRYRHPSMLLDGQRAVRYVRLLAAELKLRADRIGIMGFSAGGHLASTVATHIGDEQPGAADPIDRVSARPDFLILGYPVISLDQPYAHKGSRERLLGPSPDEALVRDLSNENAVTARTPPTFLFHTDDDAGVPPENSVAFYLALKKAGVPAEMHIYQHGRHGVGLAPTDPVLSTWPARLADWLHVRELLPAAGASTAGESRR